MITIAAHDQLANSPLLQRAPVSRSHAAIAYWLLAVCALVFVVVVVGGVTRLTHSGLSITEWQPIAGTVPPLSAADWEETFAKYRATPQYEQANAGMSLAEFKAIFWWEYVHRLLGRLVGLVFLVPFAWFVLRRQVPRGYGLALGFIFVLGFVQGALGWYMVQSGLIDEPRVSQFRLTAHLGLAFVIFAGMFWCALSLLYPRRPPTAGLDARSARRWGFGIVALVYGMVLSGGLVAGIRAGRAYNTFPLMNGYVAPPEIFMLEPWWSNFFYNMATVQFNHRAIAGLLVLTVPVLWWKIRRDQSASPRARQGVHGLLAMLAIQVALGIATLVSGVPLHVAALHQAGALVLFACALNVAHALR
ncbi:MAG: COX15/CtaA family protein [Betaproteobacteria bacterium]|nr:COX15/CtaA family protein [Betaproteobacteria bacterium]